jgi:hypothetical protein
MNCCGTLRPNREAMTKSTGQKMKLKRGDTQTRVGSNLTAIMWKGKRNVNTLTNMLFQPAEVDFLSEHGKSLKPIIIFSCGSKLANELFRLTFARDLIQVTGWGSELGPQGK